MNDEQAFVAEQRRKRRAQYDKQRLAVQAEFDASYVPPRDFAAEALLQYQQYCAIEDGPPVQERPDWLDQKRPDWLDQQRPCEELDESSSDEEC